MRNIIVSVVAVALSATACAPKQEPATALQQTKKSNCEPQVCFIGFHWNDNACKCQKD